MYVRSTNYREMSDRKNMHAHIRIKFYNVSTWQNNKMLLLYLKTFIKYLAKKYHHECIKCKTKSTVKKWAITSNHKCQQCFIEPCLFNWPDNWNWTWIEIFDWNDQMSIQLSWISYCLRNTLVALLTVLAEYGP